RKRSIVRRGLYSYGLPRRFGTWYPIEPPKLVLRRPPLYNPKSQPRAAHWCSWLTRCPLKAEITGSSPVCATNSFINLQFAAYIRYASDPLEKLSFSPCFSSGLRACSITENRFNGLPP